jgi:hypothetical protein
MFVRIVIIILGLAILTLEIPFQATAWDGLTESSEHLAIFYQPENAGIALNLLDVAEREYQRVTGTIGFQPTPPLEIFLARDPQEFRLLTLGRVPEWGIGAAVPHRGRIVLISPRHSPNGSNLHQVLAHELSHVVLGQALGEIKAPRWLDEGLAMYISHEWKLGQSILVARVLLFDSLIPLDEIENLNSFGRSRAQLAYAESFLAVAFILDRYGETGLHQLIRELARREDLDLAMRASLNMTQMEFQLAWQEYVMARFSWASILSHPFVLWMFMFSLFVLVFLVKRRRSRQIMERWRLEEVGLGEPYHHGESDERWSSP